MPLLKIKNYQVAILGIILMLGGCSQTTPANSGSAQYPLDESEFEIDQQRGLVLTHSTATLHVAQHLTSTTDETHRQQVCQIELPILHIATGEKKIVDEPKVPATLKILLPGSAPETFPIAIEWRGKTSLTFPKKSFGFELRDQHDFDLPLKQSLLGMRRDDDWILDALWNEPIAIRDFTAHQIWHRMAADHQNRNDYDLPQQRHCELFLDGEYRGIYYLGERVDAKMLKLKNNEQPSQARVFKAISWADASSFKSHPPFEHPCSQWSGFELAYPKRQEEAD